MQIGPMTSTLSSPRRGASLAYRLMLGTAVVALLCFGLTAAITYWQSSSALTASAQATMQNAARYQAEQIGSELGQALTTGKSVATTLLVQRANNSIDRDTAAAVVHDQLQDHPEWVGMGTLWEAQAFDAKDSAFVSAKGHDASGRFMTYWGRDGQSLVREPLTDYDTPGLGDWNLKPRELGRQTVAEPYNYQIGGKTVLMTTLSTPIQQDGTFLGVVTVDIALAALQQRLGALRPMDSGYVELLSPGGIVLASRDTARIGKTFADARHRAVLDAIKAGKDAVDFVPDENGAVSAYVPLQIGQAQERFALGVVVPYATIMQQAHRLLWTILLVGLGSALVLSIALFALLRRQVVRPLDAAARVADAIASGKLDNQIAVRRQDEVGRLLSAMQRMQSDLRQRIERDTQIANENLRIRTALEHSEMEVLLADEHHTAVFITEALHTSLKHGEAAFHAKGQTGFQRRCGGRPAVGVRVRQRCRQQGAHAAPAATHCHRLRALHLRPGDAGPHHDPAVCRRWPPQRQHAAVAQCQRRGKRAKRSGRPGAVGVAGRLHSAVGAAGQARLLSGIRPPAQRPGGHHCARAGTHLAPAQRAGRGRPHRAHGWRLPGRVCAHARRRQCHRGPAHRHRFRHPDFGNADQCGCQRNRGWQ